METLRRLKSLADVSTETTPQNLLFVANDYARLGNAIKASPPFRSKRDIAALAEALRDGTIDIMATDHAPHAPAEKAERHARFSDVPGGLPGVQTLLAVMLHLADRGILTLPDIARLCAANPAKRFGLDGRKGRITPGADADIVIVDPARSLTICNSNQLSKAGATPYAGITVPYWIERTLLRGETVAVDGIVKEAAIGMVLRRGDP